MYRQRPVIASRLEALDELRDVQMTLDGTSALAMALSKSGYSRYVSRRTHLLPARVLRAYRRDQLSGYG